MCWASRSWCLAGVPTGFGAGIPRRHGRLASIPISPAAQAAMCLPFKTFLPDPATRQTYEQLYAMFRALYLGFGGVEK